ncbi:MAG: HAD family hydrolase [Muribaculaceae bacterium]|nr:HAD family hydrolase [Muribaculaceae bacterium]
MKTLVIFDLDGTLLNTIDDLGNACNHALRSLNYPTHALISYNMMVGNGITKLIERALPDEARTPEVITDARCRFVDYYNDHCCDATTPYPGIPELLAELTDRNIKIAVASNKYDSAVHKIINHFFPDIPFAAIFGHLEGIPRKPDPSIVFEVLTASPTPKSEVIYVGDSAVDIETARRACVDSVGVTWGFRSETELRKAYADNIISDPDDLLPLLNA